MLTKGLLRFSSWASLPVRLYIRNIPEARILSTFTCKTCGNVVLSPQLINNTITGNTSLLICRSYAKGKEKPKSAKNKKVHISESDLASFFDLQDLYIQFQKPVDEMKNTLTTSLTLRTSAGAVDTIPVNYQGKQYLLQDLAVIGKKSPKMYILNFINFPQVMPEAIRAIHNSGMGFNPNQDGTTVYLPVPTVTKEQRETMAKNAKTFFVKCKEQIRDLQMRLVKQVQTQTKSEDEIMQTKNQLIALADKYIAEAEKIVQTKQDELLLVKK